jgi:hypothetical protein
MLRGSTAKLMMLATYNVWKKKKDMDLTPFNQVSRFSCPPPLIRIRIRQKPDSDSKNINYVVYLVTILFTKN